MNTFGNRTLQSLTLLLLVAFLFLTVVMAPVLAGAIIVTYGFFVWILQFFAGPPGPG